ncbi:MAG: hypothetical protein RIK87_12845 [Fuerstiella sp.]
MKKMMIGIYGLMILAVSAGGTWFLRQQDQTAQQDGAPLPPLAETVADLSQPVDVTQPLAPAQPSQELPAAVRPGEMSVEEIVRYGLGLKARESAIQQREEALRRTEAQHRLVLADIDGEQKEIQGLVAQARDQRMATEQLLTQARNERIASEALLKQLEEKQQKLELERQKAGSKPTGNPGNSQVNREANVKEMVSVMEGMSPEKSAAVIKQFSNDGKMEMAVEILSRLEERRAAGILDSLDDEKLASELLAQFMELKKPTRL